MPTVLITGSNRGLGFEFARQYASEGWRVVATCRNVEHAKELRALSDRVTVHKLEVTSNSEISALAKEMRGMTVDLLINNAAAQGPSGKTATFGNLDVESWLEVFRTNAIAPLKITEALIENVRCSQRKMIVFISSSAGSISERGQLPHHKPGGSYIYRTSKAALNAAAKSLAFDLKTEGISVLVLHPGWVRTDSGGTSADLEVAFSVKCMREVIASFSLPQSGAFKDYTGKDIGW